MSINMLGPILGSQLLAPMMALDWPNTQDFVVTKVERFPRGMTRSHWGWGVVPQPEELPARLIIHGTFKKDAGVWTIAINLEERVIHFANWSRLAGDTHWGSAGIGVALCGLPALIVSSPVLLVAHGGYAIQRLATGMDRHTWSIWRQLKGQLMSEDRDEVHKAFLNHCNGVEDAYVKRLQEKHDEEVRQERIQMQFKNRKDDITMGPFMVRYEAGCAEPEEVLKDYADWSRRPGSDQGVTLPEWMGMTDQEFSDWSLQKKTVDQILEERQVKKGQ